MEPSLLYRNQNPTSSKKRKNIIEEEFEVENWSRFIVHYSIDPLATAFFNNPIS
jgi:hypothetical protein